MTDGSELERVTSEAVFTVLGVDGERTIGAAEMRNLPLAGMLATRRPASHSRMRNYIGKFAAPDGEGHTHAAWFESRNELEHLRDLVLTHDLSLLTTQTVRVAWPLTDGERIHYPDIAIEHFDGRRAIVEIKTYQRLLAPEVLAQFTLMSATAAFLGWGFEVRTELPPQRAANQSHVFACRHGRPSDHQLLMHRISSRGGALPLQDCAAILGDGPGAIGAVLTLIARRVLHIDFDQPLGTGSLIHLSPKQSQEARWLHQF